MARAKRTHRAAARRRYRNEQALAAAGDVDIDDIVDIDDASPAPADRPRPASGTIVRRGFTTAFREAFRPVDVPSDIRSLPMLVRSRALWIPMILTVATAVLWIAVDPESHIGEPLATVTLFLKEYFLVPPAIGGAFITGFMAPRASWLLGVLVGLVAAAAYSLLVLNGFIGIAPTAQTQNLAQDVAIAAFVISPIIGSFFASTAAWYRRFLYLTNPNRGRRASAPARPDGRTRSSGTGQAGARR